MKPLLLLLSVFFIGNLIKRMAGLNQFPIRLIGRIAMSSMLIFTGISHFVYTDDMSNMLPNWIPFADEVILVTGLLEILGASVLLTKKYQTMAGIILIVLLICLLPANIYAALNHIDSITGATDGSGPSYLFFRIPLQFFFMAWIYLSSIKQFNYSFLQLNKTS